VNSGNSAHRPIRSTTGHVLAYAKSLVRGPHREQIEVRMLIAEVHDREATTRSRSQASSVAVSLFAIERATRSVPGPASPSR